MTLVFDPVRHDYLADGRALPSNTEILRHMGLYSDYSFAEPVHRYRGKAVHDGCAVIDGGGEPTLELPPNPAEEILEAAHDIETGYWPAFSDFCRKEKFRGICWEVALIDPIWGFAGMLDCLGFCGDDPIMRLVDIKSGEVPVLVGAQLAGYELLIRRGKPCKGYSLHPLVSPGVVLKKMALRLSKDGRYKPFYETPKGRPYDDTYWTTLFRSALNCYNARMEYGLTGPGYAQLSGGERE